MDIKMLVATLPEGENVAAWCRRLGVSRQRVINLRKSARERLNRRMGGKYRLS